MNIFLQLKNFVIRWQFVITVVGFIFSASSVIKLNNQLRTTQTPYKILALSFSFNKAGAEQIKQCWDTTYIYAPFDTINECSAVYHQKRAEYRKTDIAEKLLYFDFVWIVFYCLLIIICSVKIISFLNPDELESYGRLSNWVRYITLIIFSSAVLQNILMIKYLNDANINPLLFSVAACIKSFFLAFVITCFFMYSKPALVQITQLVKSILSVFWQNRIIVIFLFLMYAVTWQLDQGQDLLVNLNTQWQGPAFLYVVLSIFALLNWHLPKMYLRASENISARSYIGFSKEKMEYVYTSVAQNNFHKPNEKEDANLFYSRYVPRLLGVLTIIIPACAILNALDTFKINYWFDFIGAKGIFAVTLAIYFLIIYFRKIERWFLDDNGKPLMFRLYFLTIFFVALTLLFWYFNDFSPFGLKLLCVGLYIFSFLFMVIVTIRKNLAETRLKWFSEDQNISFLVMSSAFFISILFLAINIWPFTFFNISDKMFYSTISIVIAALIAYTYFFSGILIWGKKNKINLLTAVILLSILMASVNDNLFHDVKKYSETINAPRLDEYSRNWLQKRAELLKSDTTKTYPVFIVNTWGGGIRASVWTALVISQLDKMVNDRTNKTNDFQNHVFAYSGASGGTVGAAILCANKNILNNHGTPKSKDELIDFFEKDFLTPVLTGLLGRDLFFSLFGIAGFYDRSVLQEITWNGHFENKDILNTPYDGIWHSGMQTDYNIPLLFSNTSNVDEGLKGIMAPVILDSADFPATMFIRNLIKPSEQIKFITGALLSARFPIISPAAKFAYSDKKGNYMQQHFIDGGLKDNSGAETANEIYNVFERELNKLKAEDPQTYNRFTIYILSLDNAPPHDDLSISKNLFEPAAPITALNNSWVSYADKAELMNKNRFKQNYFTLKPLRQEIITSEGKKFAPVLPLGWQISNYAVQRLDSSLYCPATVTQINSLVNLVVK